VPGASVVVENVDLVGPLGRFALETNADGLGAYQALDVPAGRIQVTAFHPLDAELAGIAEETLEPPDSLNLDVTLGTAVLFLHMLDGFDGFRYDVDCRGQLSDGGRTDETVDDAYDGTYFVDVGGHGFPCHSVGALEDGGREVSFGTTRVAGLRVARKVFVPAAGGFARYLEVLTNPGPVSRTVTVHVQGYLGSQASTRVVVPPSETNNTFVLTDQQETCCDPVLAHVFAGTGAPVGTAALRFQDGDGFIQYSWEVTIPAGGTSILMHFAVQRDPSDTAGARAQAEALAALIDAAPLSGMTASERAQVVNFVIP
jgi:hypothetical protein